MDDCGHTFDVLVAAVLPGYLEALRASMKKPASMSEFDVLGNGPVTLAKGHGFAKDIPGAYVLLEDGRPIYVGISRHVFERLREHVRPGDHLTATLAYRIACQKHPHHTTAAEAMKNPDFRAAFLEAQQYLQGLDAAFVEIQNALERYVFEAYCALEFRTGLDDGGWNTFETH